MRKQFNLQDWLKDKSQKVETRNGRIVHNIWPVKEQLIFNGKGAEVCALIDGEDDALVFFEGGKYLPENPESPFDLFLVTQEPELTDFEKALESFYNHHLQVCTYDNQGTVEDSLHDGASKLLSIARKQLQPEIDAEIEKAYKNADEVQYRKGREEALKDLPRWRFSTGCFDNGWINDGVLYYKFHAIPLKTLEELPGFKEDER